MAKYVQHSSGQNIHRRSIIFLALSERNLPPTVPTYGNPWAFRLLCCSYSGCAPNTVAPEAQIFIWKCHVAEHNRGADISYLFQDVSPACLGVHFFALGMRLSSMACRSAQGRHPVIPTFSRALWIAVPMA